jgi:hypothetical protein
MTKKVDLGNSQIIRCLLFYNSLVHVLNPNTKKRKRKKLLTYYKTYGITTLKKTCGWG